ncbi:hypothetical protein [Streptomyces europaeiscabiei]|uniref:hypothetical protein n=1 Tax=Streptomyces europaeiscabiei TaxID=146819 RepID=UPI0029B2AA0F|nr:hypothetical protein [Streptomyces europaeiscabiei]MDX3866851.1 hypothetical protein [Streptomyces europaeiscabiei]MDX3873121.1 hypothetical protein [Streptomyces europaeiscabiei]
MQREPSDAPRTRPLPYGRRLRPWTVAAGAALALVTAGSFSRFAGLLVGPLHRDLGRLAPPRWQ